MGKGIKKQCDECGLYWNSLRLVKGEYLCWKCYYQKNKVYMDEILNTGLLIALENYLETHLNKIVFKEINVD